MDEKEAVIVQRKDFGALFAALKKRGYAIYGPTIQDQAILYDEIDSENDLPIGWTDEQEAGHYRLQRRDDDALFGYVVGPRSWKQFLHEPRVKLFSSSRDAEGSISFQPGDTEAIPRRAFIGVRSCELHAIAIQDKVFLGNGETDTHYARRRRENFVVAVNCGTAGATCFCASMNTGPQVGEGLAFDLAVTELIDGEHRFFMEAGSGAGAEILDDMLSSPATQNDRAAANSLVENTEKSLARSLDKEGLPEALLASFEHPRWDDVADRCLSCANCTMVCPTCFCTTVEDVTDVTGDHAERWRRWDSCFTMDFTWMSGGSARQSGKSRYRQWLTHKLATWEKQFGTSGCVGCGRCITWCPVGIDITEEAEKLREK